MVEFAKKDRNLGYICKKMHYSIFQQNALGYFLWVVGES